MIRLLSVGDFCCCCYYYNQHLHVQVLLWYGCGFNAAVVVAVVFVTKPDLINAFGNVVNTN